MEHLNPRTMGYGEQTGELRVRIDRLEQLLMFDYEPGNADALFDLCTNDGNILVTGEVKGPVTRIRLADFRERDLVLMVLDGERSMVQPVHLRKAV